MKVLIVGGGGREHALAWKCAAAPRVTQVLVAPGNAGTATESKVRNVGIAAEDIAGLVRLAAAERVDLTIIGPEAPLVAGVVDAFEAAGLKCFGPRRACAQLEGSKAFAKEFMRRHRIPHCTLRHLYPRELRCRLGARATRSTRRQGERARRRQGRGDRCLHRSKR